MTSFAGAIATARAGGCIGGLVGLDPQCSVALTAGAPASSLPRCDLAPGAFPCWRVVANTNCTSGSALSVDWNGTPPTGVTYQASCNVLG
jgi:hypothetical protein